MSMSSSADPSAFDSLNMAVAVRERHLGANDDAQFRCRIPGYLIEEEIGRGGQAVVYRALQESLGRAVAVKVLNTGVNAGAASLLPVETVTVGQEVMATEGVFAGMRGVLLEERGRTRVVVRLSGLCQGVGVDLPRRVLRAVPCPT